MKRILMVGTALATLSLSGCVIQYNGSVKVNKVDGKVATVEVSMPGSYTLRNRDDADRLVAHLESLLTDVKQARDAMPVVEKAAEQK